MEIWFKGVWGLFSKYYIGYYMPNNREHRAMLLLFKSDAMLCDVNDE